MMPSRHGIAGQKSSLIIAIYSRRKYGCIIDDKECYLFDLFDIGITVSFMILRAAELGLVAHVIAGYDPR
jgi:hypothetical protein